MKTYSIDFLISRSGSFSPGNSIKEVQWPHWDLFHLHSGQINLSTEKGNFPLLPGDSLLIPAGIKFRISCPKSISTASVQYFNPAIGSILEENLRQITDIIQLKETPGNKIDSHISELLQLYKGPEDFNYKQVLLLELCIEKILNQSKESEYRLSLWTNIINKYSQRMDYPPSIEEMASWAGYSSSWFRVQFQNKTGLQPSRYFLNMRMDKSAELLSESVHPIKEIARLHGYGNVSHFNRAFSRHFGISPGQYRKRNALFG